MNISYNIIPAPAGLAKYVRHFWVLEGNLSLGEAYIHRSMADGCAEMLFHYHGCFDDIKDDLISGSSFLSGVSGPSKKYTRFHIARSFGIFGAYLYPYAISKLFCLPAFELTNQMPDMKSLLGRNGQELEEKMLTALNNSQRMEILTNFLHKKLSNEREESNIAIHAIHKILALKGVINIKQLSGEFAFSSRQFERTFKEHAGFSPKLFSRIIRFQSALQAYGHDYKNLTELAYECGYYDQSHFIHDFKEFSGYHPGKYFSGKAEGVEWRDS